MDIREQKINLNISISQYLNYQIAFTSLLYKLYNLLIIKYIEYI